MTLKKIGFSPELIPTGIKSCISVEAVTVDGRSYVRLIGPDASVILIEDWLLESTVQAVQRVGRQLPTTMGKLPQGDCEVFFVADSQTSALFHKGRVWPSAELAHQQPGVEGDVLFQARVKDGVVIRRRLYSRFQDSAWVVQINQEAK